MIKSTSITWNLAGTQSHSLVKRAFAVLDCPMPAIITHAFESELKSFTKRFFKIGEIRIRKSQTTSRAVIGGDSMEIQFGTEVPDNLHWPIRPRIDSLHMNCRRHLSSLSLALNSRDFQSRIFVNNGLKHMFPKLQHLHINMNVDPVSSILSKIPGLVSAVAHVTNLSMRLTFHHQQSSYHCYKNLKFLRLFDNLREIAFAFPLPTCAATPFSLEGNTRDQFEDVFSETILCLNTTTRRVSIDFFKDIYRLHLHFQDGELWFRKTSSRYMHTFTQAANVKGFRCEDISPRILRLVRDELI